MSILLPFLYVRGWNVQKIGLEITFRQILIGVALTFAIFAPDAIFQTIGWYFFSDAETSTLDNSFAGMNLSFITIIVVSIINPDFEVLFVAGYVITSLKKRTSIWVAINVSILIRLLYHLYQGPVGVISIVSVGIIFSYWYARTGKSWPLIVAHGLLDFFGLLAYSEIAVFQS